MGYEYPGNWELIFRSFQRWAGFVKREIEAQDPWATRLASLIESASSELPPMAELRMLPFDSSSARTELDSFLATTKATATLPEDRLRVLEEKLDYLVDSANRQTFHDWFFLALGTFLDFLLSTPDVTQHAPVLLHALIAAIRRVGLSARSLTGPS